MATLLWGGSKFLPQAYVVAEREEEERAIKALKPNYARLGEVDGKTALVIAATHPMEIIEGLKAKVESFNFELATAV